MTRQRIISLLISSILISAVFLTGCGTNTASPTDPGYVKATAIKLGISFSFEYPISYEKQTLDAFEDTGGDPSVSLLYRQPGSTNVKADKQIYVRACEPIVNRPDAAAWTEVHINLLEENDPVFELIERSTIQVAGIDGNMVAYHSSVMGNLLSTVYTVCREAYIDYKGYIWKITVIAIEELGDQTEPDFQHLIQSFEFLD